MAIPTAHAHVAYVVEQTEETAGANWAYLLDALFDPLGLTLIIVTVVMVLVLNHIVPRIGLFHRLFHHMEEQAASYDHLRSWILRLSLGIALIGAGLSQALISPAIAIQHWPALATAQVVIGFLLLAGFILGPAIIAVIVLYGIAFAQNLYAVGNIETLAAAIALLALANSRPGLDNLIGLPALSPIKRWRPYVPGILRVGLGIAMIFLAIYEKILNPLWSAQVIVDYQLTNIVPVNPALWVLGAGVVEVLLGLLLIVGYRIRTVAAVTVIVLSLSFFYFGEEVYSHVTLFGVLSAIFITGAGRFSLDARHPPHN